MRVTIVAVCLLLTSLCTAVAQERRVALVIGNSAYATVPPLANPVNDATDIGAALSRLGFEVTTALDLDGRETQRVLRDFAHRSDGAEMSVLYYAGHGMEIEGQNYLIPIDAEIRSALDVTLFEGTDVGQLLRVVEGAKSLRLVLVDACRNNPFLNRIASDSRSLGRGLARIEPPGGVLVGYAARGGTVAFDGEGRNSPYASAILTHIEEPGLEIGKLFRRIRDTVLSETEGQQEPFTYGSLPARDIFLSAPIDTSDILRDFARAGLDDTAAAWQAFLSQHGDRADPAILRRARQRLALLTDGAARPPLTTALDGYSPVMRACDRLAGDPQDTDLPDGVAGVAQGDINPTAATTACQIAAASHPDHARTLYQLSRAQRSAGQDSDARSSLDRASALGHIRAQLDLGWSLLSATGTPEDHAEGLALLTRAMDSGSTEAALRLGDYHGRAFSTLENSRDPVQALAFYELAAERGSVRALFEIGYRLLAGGPFPKDTGRGLAYLARAAEAGNRSAMIRIANHHLSSGPDRDVTEALRWLERAAQDGDAYTRNRLAQIYKNGAIVPRDVNAAARWTLAAAEDGASGAMVEAGYNAEIGRGVPRDPEVAAEWYFRALEAGNTLVLARAPSDWDRETARALQRMMSVSPRASYRGPIDGIAGAGTARAMSQLCNCSWARRIDRFATHF